MKKCLPNFKFLMAVFAMMLIASAANAITKTAVASGNWSVGATWSPAGQPAAGDAVIIPNLVTVGLNTNSLALLSLTIDAGGTLTSSGAFTLSATTFTLNGTLTRGSTGAITGTMTVGATGVYNHNINAGTVPTATWNAASDCNINGMTSTYPGGMGQSFGNVAFVQATNTAIEMTSSLVCQGDLSFSNSGNGALRLTDGATNRTITVGGNLTHTTGEFRQTNGTGTGNVTVTGNFIQSGTGEYIIVSDNASSSLTVAGDVTISAGIFTLTEDNGNGTLNVAGDYSHTTGTVQVIAGGGTGTIVFNGTLPQTFTSGGTVTTVVGYTVNSGATLQMATAATTVNGAGTFTLSSGASLGITSTVGITAAPATATGNIRTTGGRVFNAGATYIYNNGAAGQTMGTGFPTNLTGTLRINNAGNTVTLDNAKTIANGGTVNIVNGTFVAGTNLTMASTSNITRSGGTMTGTPQGAGLYNVTYTGNSMSSTTELAGTGLTNLTLNLTAGQVLTLANARTMSGNLILTSGILNTLSNLLTVTGTSIGGGGSAASHVNGPLAKTGSNTFTFPVGNGTIYRPITVSSLSGSATITGRYTQANPKTAFGTALSAGINHIGVCEYWDLDDGAAAVNGIVKLDFGGSCNGAPYVDDPATLLVAHWNGSTWENKGKTTSTATSVTASVASTFSPFTIGSSSGFNPLPVLFNNVKAYEKGAGVQIEWTNLTEKDVVSYSVERSVNGRDFISISQLSARSNVSDAQSYLSFDGAPSSTNFYRIKVVEADGHIVYSKLMKVDIGKSPKGLILYPNPVVGNDISIGFTAATGQYNLSVVNAAGQQVYSQKISHAGGTVSQAITLPSTIKGGVYNMMISGDNYKETKMFVIQ